MEDKRDDLIRRKWKVSEVTPKVQGGYWEMDTDRLDLTNLSDSESDDNHRYIQNIAGRKLIRFRGSQCYTEILTVSKDKLITGLHVIDTRTDQDHLIAEFLCEPVYD